MVGFLADVEYLAVIDSTSSTRLIFLLNLIPFSRIKFLEITHTHLSEVCRDRMQSNALRF